ncbi:hypothetical protein BpHYR1_020308 [Brachionus plicatilis]|uniref:Uncharacterized protein n=1 Tax=Brachionus plicatilis TaxID=10195 RepID=A0A3M7RCE8_BRAPC|nr:hypothetical protein BpHYR1_020308 [Brachionus plicatilis]
MVYADKVLCRLFCLKYIFEQVLAQCINVPLASNGIRCGQIGNLVKFYTLVNYLVFAIFTADDYALWIDVVTRGIQIEALNMHSYISKIKIGSNIFLGIINIQKKLITKASIKTIKNNNGNLFEYFEIYSKNYQLHYILEFFQLDFFLFLFIDTGCQLAESKKILAIIGIYATLSYSANFKSKNVQSSTNTIIFFYLTNFSFCDHIILHLRKLRFQKFWLLNSGLIPLYIV